MLEVKKVMEEVEKERYYCDICGLDLESRDTKDYWEDASMYYTHDSSGANRGSIKRIDLCMRCMKDEVMPLVEMNFNIQGRVVEYD